MTTRPPGFGEGDPDAATNGIHGVNGHPDENVQPPWLPATRPAGQPPGAGPAGRNERVGYVPLGELDEPRRASRRVQAPRRPGSAAPAAQGRPPVMRATGQPPGAGPAGRNGRADYVPGELDEPRRAGRPVQAPVGPDIAGSAAGNETDRPAARAR